MAILYTRPRRNPFRERHSRLRRGAAFHLMSGRKQRSERLVLLSSGPLDLSRLLALRAER